MAALFFFDFYGTYVMTEAALAEAGVPQFSTKQQVAELFDRSVRTIERYVESGALETIKLDGGRVLICRCRIAAFLSSAA